MLAVLFASCAEGEVEKSGETVGDIGFTTHLTRGGSIDNAKAVAEAGGFDVWAYKHTGAWASAPDKTILIDNTGGGYGHVTSDDEGATWDYGPLQAWPAGGGKVSFFAFAPHGGADWDGTLDAEGVPVITYEVPEATGSQKDLMIATPVIDATGATADGKVKEVFHHALSRITFSALKVPEMEGNKVIVTGVGFNNLLNSGSAALRTPVSWSHDGRTGDCWVSVAGGALTNTILGHLEAQDITAGGGDMFLMPQTFGTDADIIVVFTVDDVELSWSGPIPAPEAWEPGTSYNYKILVDGDMIFLVCGSLEAPGSGSAWDETAW